MGTRPAALAHRLGDVLSLRTAPFTYLTVGLLLVTSALLRTHPQDVDGIVAWASTNVANLTRHPVGATVASAFVVPTGLVPELLVVAVSFLVVERAIGTLRVVLIAVAGHVLATLITEGAVGIGISVGLLPGADVSRSDVGISYAMFAVVAASILLLPDTPRTVCVMALLTLVTGAVVTSHDMTSFGHLLSVVIGLTLMSLGQRRGNSSATDVGAAACGAVGVNGSLVPASPRSSLG
jgi:hypothetical protein